MYKKLIPFVLGFITAAIIMSLWTFIPHHHHHDHDHDHEEGGTYVQMSHEQMRKYDIAIAEAKEGVLQHTIQAPAQIAIPADQMAHIYPKASGVVLKAYKNLGEPVEAGELLATIESQEVAEAKSEYLAALKREALTARELEREQRLYNSKVASEQEFHATQHTAEEAQIALELAKHKLYALGFTPAEIVSLHNAPSTDLSVYQVRSPIKGTIIHRDLAIGELIAKEQEIYEIGNLETLWGQIDIYPQDRHLLKEGQPVTLHYGHDLKEMGTVLFLSPVINRETQTSQAIVPIDNQDGHWLPGTFSTAMIVTKETPVALLVPKEALQNIDGNDSVFVASGDGFEARPVTVGQQDNTSVEILSGLDHGDQVACKNTFLLKAELKKHEAEHVD